MGYDAYNANNFDLNISLTKVIHTIHWIFLQFKIIVKNK